MSVGLPAGGGWLGLADDTAVDKKVVPLGNVIIGGILGLDIIGTVGDGGIDGDGCSLVAVDKLVKTVVAPSGRVLVIIVVEVEVISTTVGDEIVGDMSPRTVVEVLVKIVVNPSDTTVVKMTNTVEVVCSVVGGLFGTPGVALKVVDAGEEISPGGTLLDVGVSVGPRIVEPKPCELGKKSVDTIVEDPEIGIMELLGKTGDGHGRCGSLMGAGLVVAGVVDV